MKNQTIEKIITTAADAAEVASAEAEVASAEEERRRAAVEAFRAEATAAARRASIKRAADAVKQAHREKIALSMFGFSPWSDAEQTMFLSRREESADGVKYSSDAPIISAALTAAIVKLKKLEAVSCDATIAATLRDAPAVIQYYATAVDRFNYGALQNLTATEVDAARRAAFQVFRAYEATKNAASRDYRSGKMTLDEAATRVRAFRRNEAPMLYAEAEKTAREKITNEIVARARLTANAPLYDYVSTAAAAIMTALKRLTADGSDAATLDLWSTKSGEVVFNRDAEKYNLITRRDGGAEYIEMVNSDGAFICGDLSRRGTTPARRHFELITPAEPTPYAYVIRRRNKSRDYVQTIPADEFNTLDEAAATLLFEKFSVIVKKKIKPYFRVITDITPYDEAKKAVEAEVRKNKSGTTATPHPISDALRDADEKNDEKTVLDLIISISEENSSACRVGGVNDSNISNPTADAAEAATDEKRELDRLKKALTPAAATLLPSLIAGERAADIARRRGISKAAVSKQTKAITAAAVEIDFMDIQKTAAARAAARAEATARAAAARAAEEERRRAAALLPAPIHYDFYRASVEELNAERDAAKRAAVAFWKHEKAINEAAARAELWEKHAARVTEENAEKTAMLHGVVRPTATDRRTDAERDAAAKKRRRANSERRHAAARAERERAAEERKIAAFHYVWLHLLDARTDAARAELWKLYADAVGVKSDDAAAHYFAALDAFRRG